MHVPNIVQKLLKYIFLKINISINDLLQLMQTNVTKINKINSTSIIYIDREREVEVEEEGSKSIMGVPECTAWWLWASV